MEFDEIADAFLRAVMAGDGEALGGLFAEDGVYVDGFYGGFEGPSEIARMLREHFHGTAENFKWVMRDRVCDGRTGYAHYLFSYDSILPAAKGRHVVFEGVGKFEIAGGKIVRYSEVFDHGIALVQLGFAPERIEKSLRRWANELRTSDEVKKRLGEDLGEI